EPLSRNDTQPQDPTRATLAYPLLLSRCDGGAHHLPTLGFKVRPQDAGCAAWLVREHAQIQTRYDRIKTALFQRAERFKIPFARKLVALDGLLERKELHAALQIGKEDIEIGGCFAVLRMSVQELLHDRHILSPKRKAIDLMIVFEHGAWNDFGIEERIDPG